MIDDIIERQEKSMIESCIQINYGMKEEGKI